ncbi:LysR substrate-binding domain-containing protein, partial [Cellulomonas triticagri]
MSEQPPTPTDPPAFRLLLVPGVVPASWVRTWRERVADVRLDLVHAPAAEAAAVLAAGDADAALLRLPVDRDLLSAIPLYVETTVVVLPKDHLLTALDEVTPADLADETLITPADDVLRWTDPPGEPSLLPAPATTEDAVALVASGVGLLVVPQSLARLHHRRDLTYRPFAAAAGDAAPTVPASRTALAWAAERDGDPLVEELIGIVRGRTVNSSRGRGGAGAGAGAASDGGGRNGAGRGDA